MYRFTNFALDQIMSYKNWINHDYRNKYFGLLYTSLSYTTILIDCIDTYSEISNNFAASDSEI